MTRVFTGSFESLHRHVALTESEPKINSNCLCETGFGLSAVGSALAYQVDAADAGSPGWGMYQALEPDVCDWASPARFSGGQLSVVFPGRPSTQDPSGPLSTDDGTLCDR